MFIEEGGVVNANKSFIFYKSDSFSVADGISYPSNPDAVCINNGLLNIGSGSSIGGLIETTNTNGTAMVDFSAIDSSGLTSISPEGVASVTNITVIAEGYFFNEETNAPEIRQYVAGTTVESSIEHNECWEGQSYKLNTLKIQIDTSENYKYNVYEYVVHTYTDQNGNGATELSQDTSYNLQTGQYFSITTTRNKSASFLDSSIQFTSGQIYQMQSDMTLVIVPNKGILITYSSSSISGAGNSTFTFYESPGKSTANRVSLGTMATNSSFLIIEGYYLYFEFSGGIGKEGTVNFDSGTITPSLNSGSTLSTKTYYLIDGDNLTDQTTSYNISFTLKTCITGDTLITLADGTKKMVKDLLPTDLLLVFNHETGKYEFAPMIFKDVEPEGIYRIVNLKFSDGTIVKVVYEHGFFDTTLNKYVYIREDNMKEFIGHKFYQGNYDGTTYTSNEVTLVDAYVTEELTTVYSPVTVYHLNYFTEDMLSMPAGIPGLFNIFEYGDNLTFDKEQMEADIEKYGLYTYDDFKDYISYEVYSMFPAPYLKVAVGKGLTTYEDIIEMIYLYLEKHDLMK